MTTTQPIDQASRLREMMSEPTAIERFRQGIPGVYENIPSAVYQGLDCCSFSRLAKLARSPLHCLEAMRDSKRTPAMILGDAAHLYVLQPELVESRYIVAGPCFATKKDGTACTNEGSIEHDGQWFCGVHDPAKKGIAIVPSGRDVLSAEDNDKCAAMRDAVLSHPRARDLIEGDGPRELSIVWRDRETGIICKARIDKLNLALGAICDLKTTPSAQRKAFMRKIYGFGYHLQAGMYLPGAVELGLDARHFIIIPVEKTAPFAPAVYRFKDTVIEAGMTKSRELMRLYAKCAESDRWPGYGDQIEDIDLPDWDWRDMENGDE